MRAYHGDGCVVDLDAVVGWRIREDRTVEWETGITGGLQDKMVPYWAVEAITAGATSTWRTCATREEADEVYSEAVAAWDRPVDPFVPRPQWAETP